MKSLLRLLSCAVLVTLAGCTPPTVVSNDPPPVVILVSLDGFRWDYIERYELPELGKLSAEGVRAERMRPSFPTSTFPNHYTMVTGLRPGNHGIVSNRFLEPETGVVFSYSAPQPQADAFWGGEPIWVTAGRQGMISACMFWPGSEAEIQGKRPDHWFPYQHTLPIPDRVNQVLAWLALPEAERPQVITLYFHHADTAGHTFGVDSEPLRETAAQLDRAIGDLRAGIERLNLTDRVHFVIGADHGMTPVDQARVRAIDDWVVPEKEATVSFIGAVTGLWPVPPLTVDAMLARRPTLPDDFRVYRREDLPERWQLAGQPRIAPVVIVARPGAKLALRSTLGPNRRLEMGTHGYDETTPDMGATFLAWGPRYRRGVTLGEVDNVDLYELLCATVGLTPTPNDGSPALARAVLRAGR